MQEGHTENVAVLVIVSIGFGRVVANALHGRFVFHSITMEDMHMNKTAKTASTQKEYMTIKDVQDYLNISQSQAYQLSHRKDFPVCRFGGSIRIPRTAFLRWVEMHTRMPEALASGVA